MATEKDLVGRYQACVMQLLALFEGDPLPESDPSHFLIERLESMIKRGLLVPAGRKHEKSSMTEDRSRQDLIDELAEAYRTLDEERDKRKCSEAAASVVRQRVEQLNVRINRRAGSLEAHRDSMLKMQQEQEADIAERARLLAFLGEER